MEFIYIYLQGKVNFVHIEKREAYVKNISLKLVISMTIDNDIFLPPGPTDQWR